MFFGVLLLFGLIACFMAAIGIGVVGVVLFAIILYQPFRLLKFVPRRQMRLWLSIALSVALWVAFATSFGDGEFRDYFGSAGIVGISLVAFWIIGLDPEPGDEQPNTGEGVNANNHTDGNGDVDALPATTQSDVSPKGIPEAEGKAQHGDSPDTYAPAPVPRVSGPETVGPGLFVNLKFLGDSIEISTCARQLLEFRNGVTAIIEPFAEQISEQAKWLRLPGGGHWIDLCHDNLASCPDVLRRSLNFFQDCCTARDVFDVGEHGLEDDGLPNPRELSTIAMDAIERAQSTTGYALVRWDPRLIRAYRDVDGGVSDAIAASTGESSLFTASIGELEDVAQTAREADLAYKQEVKRLDGQEFYEVDRIMREIGMREYYLPTLAFLSRWQEGLITAYMHELGIRGQFDLEPLMGFSTDRSDAMLANLSRATDVRDLLVQAFTACPYNGSVYVKADELGFLDGEGYRSARYFGFDPLLPNATEAEFDQFLDEPMPHKGALAEAEAVRRAIFEATQDDGSTPDDMDE